MSERSEIQDPRVSGISWTPQTRKIHLKFMWHPEERTSKHEDPKMNRLLFCLNHAMSLSFK